MNRFVLVVLVLESKPHNRGGGREGRRGGKVGSWRAPFRFFACIGTMNRFVLVLVVLLLLESKPLGRGRGGERERRRGRKGRSWREPSFASRMHWDHEPTPLPGGEQGGN